MAYPDKEISKGPGAVLLSGLAACRKSGCGYREVLFEAKGRKCNICRHTGYWSWLEPLTGLLNHATLTATRRNQPKDVMLPILPRPQVGAGRIRKEREIQVHTQKAVLVNSLVCVATEIFALHRTVFSTAEDSAVFCFPLPSVICNKCYFALSHNAKKTTAYRRNPLCVL